MWSRRPACFALLASLALLVASAADAAEASRAEFREAAEPICKVDTKANGRILAGVRVEVRLGKLGAAAARFAKAGGALKRALAQLELLPRPAGDEPRLAKWFETVESEVGYFEAVSQKLKAGQKDAAEQLVSKLTVTATKANSQVLPFEFTYCRLEPSRFT